MGKYYLYWRLRRLSPDSFFSTVYNSRVDGGFEDGRSHETSNDKRCDEGAYE